LGPVIDASPLSALAATGGDIGGELAISRGGSANPDSPISGFPA